MKKTNETNFSIPVALLDFFRNLKTNNNKNWFDENKKNYEQNVKAPVAVLLGNLSENFAALGMPLTSDPKISTFRINRDIRFSANKEPYKTHLGLLFPFSHTPVHKRDMFSPCFYFHIEPDTSTYFVAGGLHQPQPEQLKYFRDKITDDYKELEAIINNKALKKEYPRIFEGERLKRVPRGYPADHPREEWLRLKEYLLYCDLEEKTILSAELPDVLTRKAAAMLPFLEYLNM
jgi:uncharacterized protein (TIGR02453 family)